MFDGEAFGQQMVEIVRGYVAAEIAPLLDANKTLVDANLALSARVTELEAREFPALPEVIEPDPEALGEMISKMVSGAVADAVAALPAPQDGKSVDITEVEQLVGAAVAALPVPRDGADCDMDAVEAMLEAKLADAVAALPAPEPGADCDMDAVMRRIAEEVVVAVSALPAAEKGEAGAGVADALIDRDGALVLTLTDGSTRNLGRVVGKDGEAGKNADTFTLDDFDIVPLDDERSFKFCFTHGDTMHSFELGFPVVLDRGVWAEGRAYVKGDAVTWAGSLWTAQRDAPGKPDTADSGWRLAVKKGRDGRDSAK